MRSYNPQDVVQQIRTRRVSVLVSVPKILDVLRDHVRRRVPEAARAGTRGGCTGCAAGGAIARCTGRLAGSSGRPWSAPRRSTPGSRSTWARLGFLVIQGYGLTETAPIVTLNHPFSAPKGSVGKPIARRRGEDCRGWRDPRPRRQRDDGLLRRAGGDGCRPFEDGWLHTGDIGGIDEHGRVFIRGRKKEMIVTPEGLNVFPEDVERALVALPGVRDAAAVGRAWGSEERVHAVLVLARRTRRRTPSCATPTSSSAITRRSGASSVWPAAELPRTEGTRKLRRRQIKEWVERARADDGRDDGGRHAAHRPRRSWRASRMGAS